MYELLAILIYFMVLLTIGYLSYRKSISLDDFIIGNRSLNYWLTALSAHASDMSNWLFLAYPASIFSKGIFEAWVAIGLVGCMFLNWQLIAPKIRIATEKCGALTFSSFFENRLGDTSGLIRIFSAVILVVFYTVYISAALIGMGDLLTSLFNIHYAAAIFLGIVIVIPYVFSGGYTTLAWIDLFQGCFLFCIIIFVPLYLLRSLGGLSGVVMGMESHHLTTSLFPDFSSTTIFSIVSMALGWGLGYFGQPHIVTKFMGIKYVQEIHKSKWIGMSWMVCTLLAATLIGVEGISFFDGVLANSEKVFISIVQKSFHPFIVGLILCAVLAATINVMSSQVLVLSSSLSEDIYKTTVRPWASSRELLVVSRLGVIFSAGVAFVIALKKTSTIFVLVQYAWSGIGSAFGPLVFLSLYSSRINKYGAWAGMLGGAIASALWPYFDKFMPHSIAPLLVGFSVSFVLIIVVSYLSRKFSSSKLI
jgi:sodium/proline symporter